MIINKWQAIFREFPRPFWTLMIASFIDRLGGALLFPFFTLYITEHFGVGMTEAGIIFTIFSISSIFGSMIGGAMTDKFGRRWMIVFGLAASALSSVAMGFVDSLLVFYAIAAFAGLFSNAGGPAQQAMVADILPAAQRAQGYGIWRVVANLAVTIGPAVGGLLAARSYLVLFLSDAVTSMIMVGMVIALLPETKPEQAADKPEESFQETLVGYTAVLRDNIFMVYIFLSILVTIVYVQMNSTMAVYLRDSHGIPAQGYGYILSLNAGMVVLFQFWITRKISHLPPLLVIAAGVALYAVGFAMYGVVAGFVLFAVGMVIITIGEMLVLPVAQALTAQFAPEDMRGRYMAMYGFSWTIPFAIGPLLGGMIMDAGYADWVWYASGILGLGATLGFVWLHTAVGGKLRPADAAQVPAD